MKIAIGNDHRGYDLKRRIREIVSGTWSHDVLDQGCFSTESVDYPDFARKVCGLIISGSVQYGILICGTGIGMSMVANRFPGIRAAVCSDIYAAQMAREHNNANIICLPGGKEDLELVKILDIWLTTDFAGGRHTQRVLGIDGVQIW